MIAAIRSNQSLNNLVVAAVAEWLDRHESRGAAGR
jgi:hypothetical protein